MRKIFISQPMNGKSERIIRDERNRVVFAFALEKEYEIIDSIINLGPANPVQYLAKSIELMNDADCVLMMKGWERARGCRIEHEVAVAYGKEIIYE